MPLPNFPKLDSSATQRQIIDAYYQLIEVLEYHFRGKIDSKNAREFGGWLVGNDQLASKSGNVGMSTAGTLSTSIRIWAGGTTLASAPFRVDEAGKMVSSDADITGKVTATSGAIGGWVIGATSLTDAAGTVGMSSLVTAGDDIRFFCGNVVPASAPFRVTEAGVLTAESGTVGGWTLSATKLSGSGILEGGTIQTADSGNSRVVLSNNSLKTFNSIDNIQGFAWGTAVSGATYGDAFLFHNGTKLMNFIDNLTSFQISPATVNGMTLGGSSGPTYAEGTWNFDGITISPVFTVSQGGTGAATLTGILKGNGTGAVTAVTPLAGVKVYYVSDTSGGAVTRKLTFTDGILTSET